MTPKVFLAIRCRKGLVLTIASTVGAIFPYLIPPKALVWKSLLPGVTNLLLGGIMYERLAVVFISTEFSMKI